MLDETQEEDGVRIYLDEMATKKPSSDEEFRPVVSREMSEIFIDLAFVGKGFSAMKKLQYGWLEQLMCETFFPLWILLVVFSRTPGTASRRPPRHHLRLFFSSTVSVRGKILILLWAQM